MLVIMPDVQITRRKRVHLVLGRDGEQLYAAATLAEVLAWLAEQEDQHIVIECTDENLYNVTIRSARNLLDQIRRMTVENAD